VIGHVRIMARTGPSWDPCGADNAEAG